MYGGWSPGKERGFDVRHGVYLEKLPALSQTKLIDKGMLDYYADEYARHGMHGPCKSAEVCLPRCFLLKRC